MLNDVFPLDTKMQDYHLKYFNVLHYMSKYKYFVS